MSYSVPKSFEVPTGDIVRDSTVRSNFAAKLEIVKTTDRREVLHHPPPRHLLFTGILQNDSGSRH
jgi:hypothetical protein